jgi:hypothetical protein
MSAPSSLAFRFADVVVDASPDTGVRVESVGGSACIAYSGAFKRTKTLNSLQVLSSWNLPAEPSTAKRQTSFPRRDSGTLRELPALPWLCHSTRAVPFRARNPVLY